MISVVVRKKGTISASLTIDASIGQALNAAADEPVEGPGEIRAAEVIAFWVIVGAILKAEGCSGFLDRLELDLIEKSGLSFVSRGADAGRLLELIVFTWLSSGAV